MGGWARMMCVGLLTVVAACAAEPAQTVLRLGFEDAAATAALADGLKPVAQPGGGFALVGDSRAGGGQWNEYLQSKVGLLAAREAYRLTLDYHIIALAEGAEAYALFRRQGGATRGWWTLAGKAGDRGRLTMTLWTGGAADWRLVLGIKNRGAVAIDNLTLETDPAERVPDLTMPKPERTWTSPGRTTYYVDSAAGDDQRDGRSEATAWKTLTRVNSGTFAPGDRIRLRAGGTWADYLSPGGRGAKDAPIILDSYGLGARPRIDCQGRWQATLYLRNTEYLTVSGLAIGNQGARPHPNRTGVHVVLNDFGDAHDIVLERLDVTDVNGSNVKDDGGGAGIHIGRSDTKAGPKSRYVGLEVRDCHLARCDRNGITMYGHWQRDDWHPNLGVVIRGNLLEDLGGDGIVPIGCDGALVERNTLRGGRQRATDAAAGIWPWSCDNTVIQFNEVSGMKGTNDGQGFDSDWNCRNTVIQYNYSHDNEGGFLLICNNGGSKMPANIGCQGTVVRYNVSQNDGERIFHLSGPLRDTAIYNNVVYLAKGRKVPLLKAGNWGGDWPEDTRFTNNIFFVEGETSFDLGGMRQTAWSHNVFFGTFASVPDGEGNLRSDPRLRAAGAGGAGFDSLGGYRLLPGSPCAAAGLKVERNGGRDLWGGSVPADGAPAIGAHQP